MFKLETETTVHLRKFSKREEIHGKDMIPAIDLAISQKGPATLLDMIHPELRAALFCNRGKPADGQLDMPVGDLPNIRVPLLEMPLALDYEQTGYALRVFYGSNEKSHVVLGLVKLHKLRIVGLAEGGSIEIHYSLSCANEINEKTIGRLGILGGHDISISLEPPAVEETPIEQKAKAKAEAEQLFGDAPNRAPDQTPEQAMIDSAKADADPTPSVCLP